MVISRYQLKAMREMQQLLREGGGELRFSQLILRASSLKKLHSQVLEEIFFARLIGSVQIDSVVPYILRMDTSTYNGESGQCPFANFECNKLIICKQTTRRARTAQT
jgi:hypothetical protein